MNDGITVENPTLESLATAVRGLQERLEDMKTCWNSELR